MFKKLFSRGKQGSMPQKASSAATTSNNGSPSDIAAAQANGDTTRSTQAPKSPQAQRKSFSPGHQPPISPVFGVALDLATRRSRTSSTVLAPEDSADEDAERLQALFSYWLPGVASQSLDYLDRYVTEEGLYRVPGSTQMVQMLQHSYDSSGSVALDAVLGIQIADVASLFKLYLRELPHRLITQGLASQIDQVLAGETSTAEGSQNGALRSLLTQMRPYEFYLLRRLCEHLFRVQAVAEVSKMTVSNLCIVFCSSSNFGIGANVLSHLIAQPDIWHGLRSQGESQALAIEAQAPHLPTPTSNSTAIQPSLAEEKSRIKAERRKSIWPIRKT